MSREIEDIIAANPDDVPAQIDALSKSAVDFNLHMKFDTAMIIHQKAFDLAMEKSHEKLPELLPNYVLTYYLTNKSNEKAIQELKKSFIKKIENGNEIWNQSKKYYVPEFETTFKTLGYHINPNFYGQTNFFPELVEYIKSDVEISLNSLLYISSVALKCKSVMKYSVFSDLSISIFNKLQSNIDSLEPSALRTIDEKKLRDLITFIRENIKLGEGKNVDRFENEIAFKFVLSSFLSKQFDGLLRINSNKSFYSSLVTQIHEKNVVNHILENMHQDLAGQFSIFLQKLWDAGSYDKKILARYWKLSLSQHSSVIEKFFVAWPGIVNSIPKSKIGDFWNLVLKTTTFPEQVISFLQKVANKANDDIKKSISDLLWNSMGDDNKMDFVAVLTDYTPNNSEGRNEVIEKCFNLIYEDENKKKKKSENKEKTNNGKNRKNEKSSESGDSKNPKQEINTKFAVSLLSHIWKHDNQESTKQKFDILLEKCHLPAEDIQLLFTMILKMAEHIPTPIENSELKKIKKLAQPFFRENNLAIARLINSLISLQKGKLFQSEQLLNIMQWISDDVNNIDSTFFSLIMMIFSKINNIQNDENSPIPTMNLTGIEILWNLLFNSSLPSIAYYMANLATRCQDSSAISEFINKCLSKLDKYGSLHALKLLVLLIEDPMDLNDLGIVRNIFIPKSWYVRVNCEEDYTNSLTVQIGRTTDFLKSMIARRTNTNESQIELLQNQSNVIPAKQQIRTDMTISVCINSSSTQARVWKKEELPSQILKMPKYFDHLFNLLTSQNKEISEISLQLLNLLESNEKELSKFKEIENIVSNNKNDEQNNKINWSELLDLKDWNVLNYRLNLLANLIAENKKKYITSFFATGGFKQLLSIILNHEEKNDYIMFIIEMLLKASEDFVDIKELKVKDYQDIGIDVSIASLMSRISKMLEEKQNDSKQNNIFSLLVHISLLDDLVVGHQNALLDQENFTRFYENLLFDSDFKVRCGIYKILQKIPTKKLEKIMYSHIEKASQGFCNEYFLILRNVALNTENPKKLWKLMFSSLKKFLMKENSRTKLEFLAEEEDQDELQQSVNELCSTLADNLFVSGSFEIFNILLTKIDGKIPKLKKVTFFLLEKIIFNTNRYIPTPNISFILLTEIIKRDDSFKLDILKFIKKLHNDCPPSQQYPSMLSSFSSTILTNNINHLSNMYGHSNNNSNVNGDNSNSSFVGQNQNVIYRGIQNMGCTCYLNSSMQQIFRIEKIRDTVLSYKPETTDEQELNTDWAAQLQLFWIRLLYSPQTSINAAPFVKNWKGWDGSPISPTEQQDAVEFVQMLLDRIDEKFPSKPVAASTQGSMLHKLKGMGVDFESDSHEIFTTFPLEVLGKSNLNESYEAFLIPDTFTHYKANDEIGYIDANCYTTIEKTPDVLICQLKRFDYDLQSQTRKKINSLYEFSFETDIAQILSENQDVPEPHSCLYELCGVVMHSGSAMGGHYYSYCKDEVTGNWFSCNDSNVNPILTENVTKNSFGGVVEVNVYDQKTKKWSKDKKESYESAYLLVYKKKDREIKPENEKKEPICLLPPIMLRKYLKEQKEMILRNALIDPEYLKFMEMLIKDFNDKIVYEFLFENVINNLISLNIQSITDSFNKCLLENMGSNKKLSKYFLSNNDQLIDFLICSSNTQMRDSCVNLINFAMTMAPEHGNEFINKIIEKRNEILTKWQLFDQIFQPIYFYVTEIDYNRNDILDSLFEMLNETVTEKFSGRELEDFLAKVNLSSVFKTILFLIIKLNASDNYQKIVIDDSFMNRWFTSPNHTFEFASLITFFLKDNKKHTDRYLNYIHENKGRMSHGTLAAHFANACTFIDSLSEYRVKWFFEKGIPEDLTGYQLSSFISETSKSISSATLQGSKQNDDQITPENNSDTNNSNNNTNDNEPVIVTTGSCKLVMNLNELWLRKWLICTDFSVRRSCKSFIYSLFPNFKPFPQSSTYNTYNSNNGYPLLPSRDKIVKGTKNENEMLSFLFDCLIDLSKSLIDECKTGATILTNDRASDSNVPAGEYFDILSWCTFYGGFDKKIRSKKELFITYASTFGSLKNDLKQASKDLIHFLSTIKLDDKFFDSKLISSILSMASKMPKVQLAKSDFIESMAEILFPLLNQYTTPNCYDVVAKSKIMKNVIRSPCLFDTNPSSQIIVQLIEKTAKGNSEEGKYAKLLFEVEIFDKHIGMRSKNYCDLIIKLLEKSGNFVSVFRESKCLQKLLTRMSKHYNSHLSFNVFDELTKCFNILNSYVKGFMFQKHKTTVFSNPIKSFVSFWKSKENIFILNKTFDILLSESSATYSFIVSCLSFMKTLLRSNHDFNENIIQILNGGEKTNQFNIYAKINKGARREIAEFTFSVMEHLPKEKQAEIAFRHLQYLSKIELFDPFVFSFYAAKISKLPCDKSQINEILIQFMDGCNDINMFLITDFLILNGKEAKKIEKSIKDWQEKCFALTKIKIEEFINNKPLDITPSDAACLKAQLDCSISFLKKIECSEKMKLESKTAKEIQAVVNQMKENEKEQIVNLSKTLESCFIYI